MTGTSAHPSRWDVERAVKASTLPYTARLVMLTLLTATDRGTTTIPAAHTPAHTQIVRETGLGRSTVKSVLRDLEAAGWMRRAAPPVAAQLTRGARTLYELAVPAASVDAPPAPAKSSAHDGPAGDPVDAADVPEGSGDDPRRVTSRPVTAGNGSGDGHVVRPSLRPSQTTTAAARPSGPVSDPEPAEDTVNRPEPTPGEQIVSEWSTTRPGITGRQRAKLAAAVNSLLRDGALPDLAAAALDEAHDNARFHSPDRALPLAYEDVLRAQQARTRPPAVAATRPAGRQSRTERARAAMAAIGHLGAGAVVPGDALQLPAAGGDR